MAKKHRNEVAVGITVLVVLVLTIYIVVVLADWSNLTTKQQKITVQLPYRVGLKGLMERSPIFLGGAKIGQIIAVERPGPLGEDPDELFVSFTMKIPAQYQLRQDCVLAPESNVLGGQASLAIKDLGAKGQIIQPGQTVQLPLQKSIADTMDAIKRELNADVPGSLMHRIKHEFNRDNDDAVITSIAEAATNLKQITDKIDQQFSFDEEQKSLIVKIHLALDKLNASLDQIDELVETNKAPVTETIASLRDTARSVKEKVPPLLDDLKKALAKADVALDATRLALDDLKELTSSVKDAFKVNRPTIDRIVRNLNEISVNLKLASREIRRAPWKLVYKPKKSELYLHAVIDSAGAFASGAESLDDASVRLQSMLQSTDESLPLDRKRLDAIIAELETSFTNFQKAEEKFWNELK